MEIPSESKFQDNNHEKIKKLGIDYVEDKLANGDLVHPYLFGWFEKPWLSQIRKDIRFRSFFNNNNLSKEMTEAYSVYLQIQKLLENQLNSIKEEDIVFFDICSGKGYLSCLLSFSYPKATIYQIDKNTKIITHHIEALSNVTFHCLNIKGKTTKEWLSKKTENKIGFLLGIHLCGDLSHFMINFYNTIPSIRFMLLCPCCTSKSNILLNQTSKEKNIPLYDLWTMELFFLVLNSKIILFRDSLVTSNKNNFINATKIDDHQQQEKIMSNSDIELGLTSEQDTNTAWSEKNSLLNIIKNHYCSYIQSSFETGTKFSLRADNVQLEKSHNKLMESLRQNNNNNHNNSGNDL